MHVTRGDLCPNHSRVGLGGEGQPCTVPQRVQAPWPSPPRLLNTEQEKNNWGDLNFYGSDLCYRMNNSKLTSLLHPTLLSDSSHARLRSISRTLLSLGLFRTQCKPIPLPKSRPRKSSSSDRFDKSEIYTPVDISTDSRERKQKRN